MGYSSFFCNRLYHLVVEEADVLLNKRDTKLLGSVVNRAVILATAGGGNVLDARLGRAEDVVDKGELQALVSY